MTRRERCAISGPCEFVVCEFGEQLAKREDHAILDREVHDDEASFAQ
jgi:hypothetical protein